MSPLMFSNPARRAAVKAARACFAVWGRPSVLSWLSRADWTPKEKGTVASFNSGKISLKGAANPVLRFWHNGVPGLDYHLRLEIMTPDNKTVELKDIDYSKLTGDRQWIEEVVDLGDYAAYDFIVLKFLGECNDKELQRLSFDAVEIYDVLGHNLCAVSTKPTLTDPADHPSGWPPCDR